MILRVKKGIVDKCLNVLLSLAKKMYTHAKYGKDKIYKEM